ncbi:MAG: chorismate synthase [Clostridia bacterium]
MSKFNGDKIKMEVWGESHSKDIGVILNGIEFDGKISLEQIQEFVNRRRAKSLAYSTTRLEEDVVIFESGIENGKINGEIVAKINNEKMRSGDYSKIKNTPRPSHADYVARVKYGDDYDFVGGGHFSGRMTAPICIAGAIAKQILNARGIFVNAYIQNIGGIESKSYKNTEISKVNFDELDSDFPLLDESVKSKMEEKIANARTNLDSVGGTIECVASGVPIGLGDYMFDSLEGKISQLIFAIPAIKGIEFGDGFDFKGEVGSFANDQMRIQDGKVKIISNHNGGILGGISNGEPLTLAVVVKPTPSISKPQQSVNLVSMQDVTLEIGGRHDACIVPRAVPVVEAVVMLAILDEILK